MINEITNDLISIDLSALALPAFGLHIRLLLVSVDPLDPGDK
jgi:hypothetical protein